MTRLLHSELLRLLSRRMIRVLTLLAIVGIAVGCVIAAVNSHRPTIADRDLAAQTYRSDLEHCLNGDFIPETDLPPDETLGSFCAENVRPEFYEVGAKLKLADLSNFLKGGSFILIVIGLMIGASSVGADWQQGTMATLLTWEPRRVRVLTIRALVIVAIVFVLGVALQALLGLGIAAGAGLRGTTAGTASPWLREVAGTVARIAASAAIVAVVGAAIASIGRHTAAALGAVFVYLAVVESLLRGLVPRWIPNMLSTSLVIFIDGRASDPGSGVVSVTHAIATLATYTFALMIVALLLFRARDVN